MRVGISEIEIGGVKRGFKFGTYAMGVACKEEGCDMVELTRRMDDAGNNILSVLNFLYGAAVAFSKSKKQEVDFTASDVSDWFDEVGLGEGMKILREGMKSPNGKALETPGQS